MTTDREQQDIDFTLLPSFIIETEEQLEILIQLLLLIEENPERQADHLDELFRLIHQLKGSSAIVGLTDLSVSLHEVENLLEQVREKNASFEEHLINLLIEFATALEAALENQLTDFNKDYWISRFRKCHPDLEDDQTYEIIKPDIPLILSREEKELVASSQEEDKIIYGIELLFTQEAPLRSVVAIAFYNYLQRFGEILTTAPPFSQLAEENFAIFKAVLISEKPLTLEEQQKIITFPVNDGVEKVYIREWTYRKEESSSFNKTIRVDTEQIDELIKQLEKLSATKTALCHLYSLKKQDAATWEELGANLKDLEHLVASLQLEVDNLRMVPVKQIFSRFTNFIRKMAQQTKKIVKIELRDQNIKIDKDIAEQLIDPLTQLIKNAIDHGIETPAERKQAGKKEAGTIWLEARQDGKYLHISVRDDGRGLDFIKISSTAVARKLTADQKRFSTDNISELQQIIFTPGFSTSEQVNNLSGRGVGLDIVKTNLDKLQGIIEIISQEQQGATFTLKIPFTFIEGPTLNKGN